MMHAVTDHERDQETASPEIVSRRVQRALQESAYADLHGLRCVTDLDQEGVVLQGRVATYFLKQMAQTIAARIPGVLHVDNRVKVP